MQALRVSWGHHKGRPITGSAATQKCYTFLFIFIPLKIISFSFGFNIFFFDLGRSLDILLSCLVSKHLDFPDIFVLLKFSLILLWTERILWFKHSNIFDCVYWQNIWPMVVNCLCDLECESCVLGERVPRGQLGQVRGQCVLMGYLSNLLLNPERCSGLQLQLWLCLFLLFYQCLLPVFWSPVLRYTDTEIMLLLNEPRYHFVMLLIIFR